jgi:hypothetical protein
MAPVAPLARSQRNRIVSECQKSCAKKSRTARVAVRLGGGGNEDCYEADKYKILVANSLREIARENYFTQRASRCCFVKEGSKSSRKLQTTISVRRRYDLKNKNGLTQPGSGRLQLALRQDLCCPQTVCGQHCPWEPTALHQLCFACQSRCTFQHSRQQRTS